MHKLFVIGAIYMSYLLVNTQLHAAIDDQNMIHQAYEQVEKDFNKPQPGKSKTQMLPDEQFSDFPKAINVGETDKKLIADYYTAVSQSYKQEADKLYQTVLKLHDSKTRNTNKIRINSYRGENQKYVSDLTKNKSAASTITPDHPFKSEKHVPEAIRRDAKIQNDKAYNMAKTKFDEMMYKANFYKSMAEHFKIS